METRPEGTVRHSTIQANPRRASTSRWTSRTTLPILIIGILTVGSAVEAATAQPPQPAPARGGGVGTAAQVAEVAAVDTQIRNLQQELTKFTSVRPVPGSEPVVSAPQPPPTSDQLEELTRQREDLALAVQQLQRQLEQVPPNQEPARRWMQGQVDRIQGRLRDLDEQIDELQRARIRADYEAALQARRQAEAAGEPVPAEVEQLLDTTERRLRTIEPRLQEFARGLEQLRESVNTMQQNLQQVQDQRNKEIGQLQVIVPQIGVLSNQLRALEQQMRATSETVQGQQQERQTLENQQTQQLRQQEDLRAQLRSLQQQLTALTQQAGPERDAAARRFDRLDADVQYLRQTIERIERERLDLQDNLRTDVQALREQLGYLRGNVMQMQGALSAMMAQIGRNTVGSAW